MGILNDNFVDAIIINGGNLIGGFRFSPGLDVNPTNGLLYGAGSSLRTINPLDGSYTNIGSINSATVNNILMKSIAFAPDGTLYGISNNDKVLFTIDTITAFATPVGIVNQYIAGIDFAPDGTMYGAWNDLFKINPQDGKILEKIGSSLGYWVSDIDFAPDGFIYASTSNKSLYKINPSNGSSTFIGEYSSSLSGVASISNDNPPITPILSIASTNAIRLEGNIGTTPFTFTVTRTGDTTGISTSNWAVTGTGANPANATDFVGGTLPTGTVTFAAGVTSQVITVNVQGDTVVEPDETLTVTLSNPSNATITTATAIGTILSDDTPPVERDRQQITSLDNLTAAPGGNVSIPLFYNTSTGDNTVTGINLRLHYDSNELTFQNVDNFFTNSQFVDLENLADTRDFDNNPETDRYIQFGYADFAGNWPNQPLPLKLGDFNFTTSRDFEGTQLNVTSDSLAPGYSLESDSIFVGKQAWNLDIDGDGRINALSDGIMIVRYLFGTFPGDRLINGAISPNATRNLAEIEAYLQKAVDDKHLDIDGDGRINALSDGIMIVRHLFGSNAFPGEKLIEGAISPDATRDLGQIQAHLTQFSTVI